MELKKYIQKKVEVNLNNGFFYRGVVESADEDSLLIIDKFGDAVSISGSVITLIREVKQ